MMKRFFHRLSSDRSGSVVIEFALIGPTLIAMLFGVLQIGLAMQNYNALRSASADAARYAVVNYQALNNLNDTQIAARARSLAVSPPYGLISANLTVSLQTATTQRVAGATEKTLSLTYNIPTVLSIIGFGRIPITYNRPIFLIA